MAGPHAQLAEALHLTRCAVEHGTNGDLEDARAAVAAAARRILTARTDDDDRTTTAAGKRLLALLSGIERALEAVAS